MNSQIKVRPAINRRGSTYIAVLGTAMLVVTIGVAALYAVGVRRLTVERRDSANQAELAAQSLLEIGLLRLGLDRSWNTTFPNSTWVTIGPIDGATGQMQVVYDSASVLTDDWIDATVRIQSQVGQSLRVVSAQARIASPGNVQGINIISDPGMESGVLNWSSFGPSISWSSNNPHTGSRCLFVDGRSGIGEGVHYTLTGSITNGQAYDIAVWVRQDRDPADKAQVSMVVMTTLGSTSFSISTPVDAGWVRVQGQITPTWTGTLTGVFLKVSTTKTDERFSIDDVVVAAASGAPAESVSVDASTWKRELMP